MTFPWAHLHKRSSLGRLSRRFHIRRGQRLRAEDSNLHVLRHRLSTARLPLSPARIVSAFLTVPTLGIVGYEFHDVTPSHRALDHGGFPGVQAQ